MVVAAVVVAAVADDVVEGDTNSVVHNSHSDNTMSGNGCHRRKDFR